MPLHRNGTVFVTVPQQEIKTPHFFQDIGCEGSFGQPKLKSMTVDNFVLKEFNIDKEATQRLQHSA